MRFLELKEQGGYKLPVTGVSMCVMRGNEHEQEMFEKFWIDKVDMVSLQAFTHLIMLLITKICFKAFFQSHLKEIKLKIKPKHKYRILDVCNHFKEW